MECRTDDWHIDVCVTGSQKALMLPPGLAFVSVSEKAWKEIEATPARELLLRPEAVPGQAAGERHAVHAGEHADQGAAGEPEEDPGRGDREPLGAARPDGRRRPGRGQGDGPGDLRRAAEQRPDGHHGARRHRRHRAAARSWRRQYGYKLANGQDTLKGKIWRLSHMGYSDAFDVMGALSALELVLLDAGFKLEPGAGVAAAQRALAGRGECRTRLLVKPRRGGFAQRSADAAGPETPIQRQGFG